MIRRAAHTHPYSSPLPRPKQIPPRRERTTMTMLRFAFCLVIVFASTVTLLTQANEPVRMGCSEMTFDTVPGWGLRPDGHSPLGPTHGGVVIDKQGNIYTSAQAGVFVFFAGRKSRPHLFGERLCQPARYGNT